MVGEVGEESELRGFMFPEKGILEIERWRRNEGRRPDVGDGKDSCRLAW